MSQRTALFIVQLSGRSGIRNGELHHSALLGWFLRVPNQPTPSYPGPSYYTGAQPTAAYPTAETGRSSYYGHGGQPVPAGQPLGSSVLGPPHPSLADGCEGSLPAIQTVGLPMPAPSNSPTFRREVASTATQIAAEGRRKDTPRKYLCPYCPQAFTKRHNLEGAH
jgi:hypothetical protein